MDYNSPTGDHGSPDSVRSLPRMEGPSLTRINTHSSQKQPVRSRNMDVEAEPSHPTPHTHKSTLTVQRSLAMFFACREHMGT